MLRIFTSKFEEKTETINDTALADFLSGKDIIRWESSFFTRKNDHYWTVIVEYEHNGVGITPTIPSEEKSKKDDYKKILGEDDWPLFKALREWRGEKSKDEGVPPYIIFTNMQLAKISITRPVSLNALQQIEGIGNAKREKYGKEVIAISESFERVDSGEN